MTIRVNPNYYLETVSSLYSSQQNQNTALQQLSTGKRVNAPSDDPSAAALNVGVQDQLSSNDQYTKNATGVVDELQTADSALSSTTTLLNQAISLGVEGGNSTLTTAQRQTLAQQVQSIQSQVASLANTTYQGSYIFAGTKTQTQPFTATADPTDSSKAQIVTYNGDNNTDTVQISNGLSVQTNLPGSQIFASATNNVFTALKQLSDTIQSGGDVTSAVSTLQSASQYLSGQQGFYGNTQQQVQSTESFLSTDKVQLSSQQNDLIGADLNQTITNLEQAETARQAVLSATSQISQTNLFSYLK